MSAKRRWLVILGAAVAAGALFLLSRSDERRVQGVLERAAAALSARTGEDGAARNARLERELAILASPEVRVDVAGLLAATGRAEIVLAVAKLARDKRPVLALTSVDVRLQGRDHASASFRVSTSESQAGDLHARARTGRATLSRSGESWRIDSVTVEAEAPTEPEPRP